MTQHPGAACLKPSPSRNSAWSWHRNFPLQLCPHEALNDSNGRPIHLWRCSGKHFFQCSGKTTKTRSFIFACEQAKMQLICLGKVPSRADSAANILRVSKLNETPRAVALNDNIAYALLGDAISVVNFEDPIAPTEMSRKDSSRILLLQICP